LLNEKKLNVSETFKYMRHILKGFMELIKKGIIHGNLTPSNILFHNGLMRLADFGLSNNLDIESVYSRIKNTIYLAPEVLEGKKYTDKSDIWSLGFIVYEVKIILI
jgi:serine/threonine-protein kinase ULK/ATG1